MDVTEFDPPDPAVTGDHTDEIHSEIVNSGR